MRHDPSSNLPMNGCYGGYTLLLLNGWICQNIAVVIVTVLLLLCLSIVDITRLWPFPLLLLILILLALRYHPVLLYLLPLIHRIILLLRSSIYDCATATTIDIFLLPCQI
mmetsp:Transcript_18367/g.20582  ORF Transcript_18367/g.20582 Transcript_18367/m.20582 type:complete len:110 (+) Transcript_18367:40-369(+)